MLKLIKIDWWLDESFYAKNFASENSPQMQYYIVTLE